MVIHSLRFMFSSWRLKSSYPRWTESDSAVSANLRRCDGNATPFPSSRYIHIYIYILRETNYIAGLRRKQGYRPFLWHIRDLVMEVTMCCEPTILVYVGIWMHLGLSCIWVLYCCCCKMRPNVLLQRPAETRWRDGQFFVLRRSE